MAKDVETHHEEVEKPGLAQTLAQDPYAGLSAEDASFMRRYEGKAGKAVVRKVSTLLESGPGH
jgi:hypothetical protein